MTLTVYMNLHFPCWSEQLLRVPALTGCCDRVTIPRLPVAHARLDSAHSVDEGGTALPHQPGQEVLAECGGGLSCLQRHPPGISGVLPLWVVVCK